MVVGNGLIAKRFRKYSDDNKFLIFASGVSNSKSTVQSEYNREFDLLKKVAEENKDKVFVYFSTCSINDPAENRSAYIAHKKNIENFIQANIANYLICRVSNLVGSSANANTILNFIVYNIRGHIHFDVWQNATRNLIDVDDLFTIVDHILQNGLFLNQIINIANSQNYSVPEIVSVAEQYLNAKANYTLVEKGGSFNIDISEISPLFEPLHIHFNEDHLKRLLLKYY